MMAGATPQTQQPNQFDELKDIVSATLEKQGILAKVQAQLRKHVFEALSVTEQQDKEKYNVSPQIDETDVNDKFAMALIRDFLSYHHLDYTLSLMNTESQKKLEKTQNITRNEIASRLGLGAQKPNPDCSLLHQLVKKLFDNDVLRPRNSTLSQDIKLKPRPSNDSYRSTLDSVSLTKDTIVLQQNETEKQENQEIRNVEDQSYTNPLENLTFSGSMSSNLPPIGVKKTEDNGDKLENVADTDTVEDDMDLSILEPDEQEMDKTPEVEEEDVIDPLEDLLDSSSNNSQGAEDEDEDEEEVQAGEENEDEELKRIKQMNKAMEQLRQQTTEFEKLKKESISPSVTEYDDDDFGSEEIDDDNQEKESKTTTTEQNEDDTDIEIDIEEDIDEDIEIDADSTAISNDTETADNIYSAKDEDDSLAKDVKLENVADIIMDVKAEKIKFQL